MSLATTSVFLQPVFVFFHSSCSNLIQLAVPIALHALVPLPAIGLEPFSTPKDVVILLGHSQPL